jgi:hypothetical protein
MPDIALSWTDNSDNEDGFRIYRSTVASPSFPSDYSQIATVGANTTSYTDTGVGTGEFSYAVTAYNAAGESSETSVSFSVVSRTATSTGQPGQSATARSASKPRTGASAGQPGQSAVSRSVVFVLLERTAASAGQAGGSAASRAVAAVRTATSAGGSGRSRASRTLDSVRTGASAGQPGESAAARAVARPRTAASAGQPGRSSTARILASVRAAASAGQPGASAASRIVSGTRTATSAGEPGQSATARSVAKPRTAASAGEPGASVARLGVDAFAIRLPDGTRIDVAPESITLTPTRVEWAVPDAPPALRDAIDRAGSIEAVSGVGGAFRVIDRGDNRIALSVPDGIRPAQRFLEGLVDRRSTTQLSPVRDDATLAVRRPRPRDAAGVSLTAADSGGTGDYEVAWLDGTGAVLALDERQVGPRDASAGSSGTSVSMPLRLSPAEVGLLADRADRPDAIVSRPVPDGRSELADSSGGRHTVSVSTPADAPLADGTYLLTDWSATKEPGTRTWDVSLSLHRN